MIIINRLVILFIFAVTLAGCSSSEKGIPQRKVPMVSADELMHYDSFQRARPYCSVVFIHGCASIRRSKINVYAVRDKYYAVYYAPIYYDATPERIVWTVEMTKQQIEACGKFLKKAKSLPSWCRGAVNSSVAYIHVVSVGDKTYTIDGYCGWGGLDFDYLDELLFGANHVATNEKMQGRWYLQNPEKMVADSVITFSRNNVTSWYVDFGKNHSVTGKLPGISYIHTYDTRITEDTVLFIYKQARDDGYHFFRFRKIDEDEIKLTYYW